jgi:hypothetical protein
VNVNLNATVEVVVDVLRAGRLGAVASFLRRHRSGADSASLRVRRARPSLADRGAVAVRDVQR